MDMHFGMRVGGIIDERGEDEALKLKRLADGEYLCKNCVN